MSESWASAYAKCPFYIFEEKQRIQCEGFIEGTKISTAFRTIREKANHMEVFCFSDYDNCAICRALMKQYEEKDAYEREKRNDPTRRR